MGFRAVMAKTSVSYLPTGSYSSWILMRSLICTETTKPPLCCLSDWCLYNPKILSGPCAASTQISTSEKETATNCTSHRQCIAFPGASKVVRTTAIETRGSTHALLHSGLTRGQDADTELFSNHFTTDFFRAPGNPYCSLDDNVKNLYSE
ncbi:hypothetical protein T265_01733 [Opisthorchis viverrini]|uniref:Uncharacterized protein n=1 Tax=Opisthorchis viverrini TaxID=6198 RepID=A0A074ZYG0_OPIVI|nr:hypothetical protein T265_01733 [Opisthorchis viverrini]KER32111.1 hypothetical protein T265_01733 [Opisthorchis viverrini]